MTKEAVVLFSKISALYSTEHNRLDFDPSDYEWKIGESVYDRLMEGHEPRLTSEPRVKAIPLKGQLMGINCTILFGDDVRDKIELWRRVGRMIG